MTRVGSRPQAEHKITKLFAIQSVPHQGSNACSKDGFYKPDQCPGYRTKQSIGLHSTASWADPCVATAPYLLPTRYYPLIATVAIELLEVTILLLSGMAQGIRPKAKAESKGGLSVPVLMYLGFSSS